MKAASLLATALITLNMLVAPLSAQTQTVSLRITSDVSSKMPTGTQFEAKDASGRVYHGHLVTHHAGHMMRNGSMILVFDDEVKAVNDDREGAYHGGNKIRLLKLGGSLALAKLADDSVDTSIGATKARYVAAAVAVTFLLIMKGQEAKLHAGDTIQVSPGR